MVLCILQMKAIPLCFDGLLWPCCDPVVATFPQHSRKLLWLQPSTVHVRGKLERENFYRFDIKSVRVAKAQVTERFRGLRFVRFKQLAVWTRSIQVVLGNFSAGDVFEFASPEAGTPDTPSQTFLHFCDSSRASRRCHEDVKKACIPILPVYIHIQDYSRSQVPTSNRLAHAATKQSIVVMSGSQSYCASLHS